MKEDERMRSRNEDFKKDGDPDPYRSTQLSHHPQSIVCKGKNKSWDFPGAAGAGVVRDGAWKGSAVKRAFVTKIRE